MMHAKQVEYHPTMSDILANNRAFVGRGGMDERPATGRPAKQLAIVTCMDARLTELLPQALGIRDGDAAIIQVAGATIVDPYGEAMRSLIVAIAELGVTNVMVIGHTDCGTRGMEAKHLLATLEQAGVPHDAVEAELAREPRAREVLTGFNNLEDEVARSVRTIRSHPLVPESVRVAGFTIDVVTGALSPVDA